MAALRVGSRGSELALTQSRMVMNALDIDTELVIIQTKGDRVTDRPLNQIGGTPVGDTRLLRIGGAAVRAAKRRDRDERERPTQRIPNDDRTPS